MNTPTIYDPSQDDSLGALRGGGRIVSILRENLEDKARFISDLAKVSEDDTLLIPLWRPFQKPLLSKRIAKKQMLMIFDAIPLKFPQHFPIGLKGRWRLIQNLQSLNSYDKIITISEHSKVDIADYMTLDKERIEVVYPTTAHRYFKPVKKPKTKSELAKKYNLPKGKFALYVGDTNWNKNLYNLAQALIAKDITCVFVGSTFSLIQETRKKDSYEQQDFFATSDFINHPEQRAFKEFMKLALHDEKHFVFPGYVEDNDLIQLYRIATCNVLVSRDEGFGLSYLEAGTQKCPSVLADRKIFREIAGKSALFADPLSPEAIGTTIDQLFTNVKLSKKVANDAYKRSAKFAPNEFSASLLKALS